MRKIYLILTAVAGMTITSCTTNDFIGEAPTKATESDAISFGSGASALTRTDLGGSEAADKLNNEMKVYGVKKTGDATYGDVFVNYSVLYDEEGVKTENEENVKDWYYVGAAEGQTIKYWDFTADDYRFVAGSPVANFTFNKASADATDATITTATVTGFGGRLDHTNTYTTAPDPVYIADPVIVAKDDYKQPVTFTFRSMQSKVRVGIYETIPGYEITEIKFYQSATSATADATNYVTLFSTPATADTPAYFQGGSANGTVTYDWTTTSDRPQPTYTFAYTDTDASGLKTANYWEGGKYTAGVPAVSSTSADLWGADDAMAANGWFVVMPTPSATEAAPLTIKCDFTLTSLDGSGETIEVEGANATIPSDWTKWVANTTYTYIFKITKDTNGTINGEEHLYPITFDAVVVNEADGTQTVGTETTFTTPSITVSQDGSEVKEDGIIYKAGEVTIVTMEDGAEATGYELSYVELDGTTFDYTADYEKLGASGAATTWTPISDPDAFAVAESKTYVIKATKGTGDDAKIAYFVLVVSAAEVGPDNTTPTPDPTPEP